jgi:hypothetical protein
LTEKPFEKATRLVNLRRRQAEITDELTPEPEAERRPDDLNGLLVQIWLQGID